MRKRNLLLSIASGLVLALAMPWPGLWMLSWVGLAPLFIAVRGSNTPRAMGYGFITGLIYYAIIIYWMALFGYLPWLLLASMQAIFLAIFAGITARLTPSHVGWKSFILIPAAWTTLQWLRSLGTYSLTWGSFAHIHANTEPLLQLGAVTGPWGIDFLICFINLAVFQAVSPVTKNKRFVPAATAAILIASVWTGGILTMRTNQNPDLTVVVIQGNAFQDVDPDSNYLDNALNTYKKLSLEAAKSKPDIIVWPETVLPVNIDNSYLERKIAGIARESQATLICGAYTTPYDANPTVASNGAHFFGPDGEKLGTYRKVRLVPFGEFVPLRDQLPFLKDYGVRPDDVIPGHKHVLVGTQHGKAGVSICFESLFPQISRSETRNGADLLFVITNDGWFGQTQAPRQHLMMAKLRAAENHRYVMRAAATGISAVIDPYGRTVTELDLQKRGVIEAKVKAISGLTLYARFGDWFAYACVLAAASALLFIRSKKQLSNE